MTIESLWLQAETYPARVDRALIDAAFHEGVVLSGLAVSQRAAGANNSVDVAVGHAIVTGDDQANQGKYLVHVTAIENVALTAAPGSNSRIDLVVLQVRDPNAGGAAGSDAIVSVVTGVAAASPSAPAVPSSALLLAQVLRTTGDTSITNAMITDKRADALPAVLPRKTTTQRNAMVGVATGYTIYNTTTAQIETYNGATWDAGAAPATPVDVQTFTANGTWTKPANAKWVEVHLFGGGGGGGGGEGRAAGNARHGGGGGGGGAHIRRTINAASLGSTVSVTVGAAGTAGTGGSSGNGNVGGAGGNSIFGNYVAYGGGQGGAGNSVASGGGGGGSVSVGGLPDAGSPKVMGASTHNAGEGGGWGGGSGGNSGYSSEHGGGGGGSGSNAASGNAIHGGDSVTGGTGGGGGAGISTGNAAQNVGNGGSPRGYSGGGLGGAAGGAGSAGAAGTAGTAYSEPNGGGGGGGGAPHTAGTGGVGGAGAIRGGGGGGGGGGTSVGGAGGAGGRGEVVVITYF